MSRNADRRDRILQAAATHFLNDGFERTSMDKVAAGAKVSKQAIYELFRDKEDLFDKVVRTHLAPAEVTPVVEQGDVTATLENAAERLFDGFREPRNFGLFRANIVAMRRFPQLAADLHDYRRSGSRNLDVYLEQQISLGVIAAGAGNAAELATRLGGMAVEGVRYFLGFSVPAKDVRRQQAELATQVFCYGITTITAAEAAAAASLFAPQPEFDPQLPEPPDTVQMRMPQQRFEALCDAAADEFLAQGFDGANIDAIATACGVGRATIYRHFGGKAGLFTYVVEREIARQWCDIPAPDGDTALIRTELLCREVLDLHLEPRSLTLHYLLVQESAQFPELARRFYDMQVDRAARPFRTIAREAGIPAPAPVIERMLHTLAVYGVRYVVSLRAVDEIERTQVSQESATIVWVGMAGTVMRQTA